MVSFLFAALVIAVILLILGGVIDTLQRSLHKQYKALHPHTAEDLENARKDSVRQSRATVAGKVSEHLAPFLPEFGDYNLKDARFLGSPIDFVVFDGLDSEEDCKVVFIEVKTGNSQLTPRERRVRDAVKAGNVEWSLVRIDKKVTESKGNSV